ncbi:hypothetical protein FHX42_002183 [Saccharopolyspora lacisalsi]|uniref:Uncharacterized protein n=1 Tax=Halosaccharopolyspora lacisalsi TaxID=1000566 RepID=A0A839DX78_9PSEU|nr:hypothetical protein [Halosaccharopolyspora lacisalsi]MBA8824836.1 hypothetical protein [Halosaccharopolyspora lacisalsi]
MSGYEARVARLMRLEIIALVNAVDDFEDGRYSAEQRGVLAGGLETLATALRERNVPVVESERVGPQRGEPVRRPGIVEGGRLS